MITDGGLFVQPQEKQIILREIELWKTSRLLPKEYCDFLMNLYLGGEQTANQRAEIAASTAVSRFTGLKQWFRVILYSLLGTFGLGMLLQFHMFSYRNQAYILATVIIGLGLLAGFSKRSLLKLVFMSFLSVLLIVEAYIVDQVLKWPLNSLLGAIPLIVAACGWILVGIIGRSKWISSLGVILLVLIVNIQLNHMEKGHSDYLHQHLYAIGIMLLTSVIARFSIAKGAKTSIGWLVGTVFALFLPDINEWSIGNPLVFIWEGILFFKVLLLSGFIVVWRQSIYSWWKL